MPEAFHARSPVSASSAFHRRRVGLRSTKLLARHLTSELDVFDVRVFEQASRVGGIWVYSENTGIDERGIPVHSSMSFLLIHT